MQACAGIAWRSLDQWQVDPEVLHVLAIVLAARDDVAGAIGAINLAIEHEHAAATRASMAKALGRYRKLAPR